MHELILVLSDFYVSQETSSELPAGVELPGLRQAARFAARSRTPGGWRSWLSRWLTGSEGEPPATVATAAVSMTSTESGPACVSMTSTGSGHAATSSRQPNQARLAFMATPLNLIAGMTSIHLDRRSILRLDANDQAALAADFQRVFHDSGFHLQPLDAGDFVMLAPPMPVAESSEPARLLGGSMAEARGAGAANPALLRLGAEIEMWLHDHAVNDARRRRGEQPVTALWLWGGGSVPAGDDVGAAHGDDARKAVRIAARDGPPSPAACTNEGPQQSDIAFGRDSYLQGLWSTSYGAKVLPLPQQLADVFGYPHAQRAVLVIEIGLMLQSNPSWTFFDAVAHIDRAFITPAIEALNRGQYERLVILANDHELMLRARDRLKFWRRTPPGLSGLQ